jgi:glyoxylase-like metal-dependent hydrolase (beta-lactamase superfamily II)
MDRIASCAPWRITEPHYRGVNVIFRQLFDPETSTYTYLLADDTSREAVLIDPVFEQFERDRVLLEELELSLRSTLETHVHADHVTASGRLRGRLGSQVVVGAATGVTNADVVVGDGDAVRFGMHALEARLTPGHTDGCVTYVCREAGMAFTGDALLIRGCGRTDFQQGDAAILFASVHEKIFSLPDATLLYPGHDYRGRTVTTVAEEKRFNPRLGFDRSAAEFVAIMKDLALPLPRKISIAVAANLESGVGIAGELDAQADAPAARPDSVAGVMESLGRQDAEVWMGMGI